MTERRTAKVTEGRVQPGSGAPWGVVGDVEVNRNDSPLWWTGVIYECKQTEKDSYRLTRDVLAKVHTEAASEGKLGILMLDISGTTIAVLDFETMADLLKRIVQLEERTCQCQ